MAAVVMSRKDGSSAPVVAFGLRPRAPFRLDFAVWTLRRQAHNAVDRWDGERYRRVLALDAGAIEICVRQRGSMRSPRLIVELLGEPAPDSAVQHAARHAVRRMLGLGADLGGFYALAAREPALDHLAGRFIGMRPPRYPGLFEALANAVVCQQISLHVGIVVLNRLAEHFGVAVGRGHAFPRPADLLAQADPLALRALGFSMAKAHTLLHVAELCAAGELSEESLDPLSDHDAIARLTALRGIGRWSAEYVLLRGLGRWHVFPGDDVGARKHLAEWLDLDGALDYDGVAEAVTRWRDYAGLLYFHLLLRRLDGAGLLQRA